MADSIRPRNNGDKKPLPAPNVVVANPLDQPSPAAIKGMLINPMYTGVGPFPPLVEDAVWVRACARLIADEGSEQFLVNLLFILRDCLPATTAPKPQA
jgi:hypothetical protein